MFQDLFGNNCDLPQELGELESKGIIKRVGFYENRIVLTEHAGPWAVNIQDKLIIPTPWVTFEGTVRPDIFFKWSSVIMNKVFEQPGCSIAYVSNIYEFLTTRTVQEVCLFLEKCQCVKLQVLRPLEIDLFSDEEPPEFLEFNPYEAPENIYIFPLKDSFTKYANVRRMMLSNNK